MKALYVHSENSDIVDTFKKIDNNIIKEDFGDSEHLDDLYSEINGYDDIEDENVDFSKYDVDDENLKNAKELAREISDEEGVVQHVNKMSNGRYEVSDWYDDLSTVASYENGERIG